MSKETLKQINTDYVKHIHVEKNIIAKYVGIRPNANYTVDCHIVLNETTYTHNYGKLKLLL